MEQLGDFNKLSDEERLALRSLIAEFNAHDAFRSQETQSEESQQPLDLTKTDLGGILPPSQKFEDIYAATRNDFIQSAPSTRERLVPRKNHLR